MKDQAFHCLELRRWSQIQLRSGAAMPEAATAAQIRAMARELPYGTGTTVKRKKERNQQEN